MYYDGANWQWEKGDEMGKLVDADFAKQLLSDLDRIKEILVDIKGPEQGDVKKPERKLWEIIKLKHFFNDPQMLDKNIFYANVSCSAIAAVIECYENWKKFPSTMSLPFPEYLKENLL